MNSSPTHSTLEELASEHLVEILEWLGVAVEPDAEFKLIRSEFSNHETPQVRADLVFAVGEPPSLALVVEVQRAIKADKPGAWTMYVAHLFRILRCPVLLIVLTDDLRVEEWAGTPIESVFGQPWRPLVLGPSRTPKELPLAQVLESPSLGMLCSVIHRDDDEAESLYTTTWTALKVHKNLGHLADNILHHYTDMLFMVATQNWRQNVEETDMEAISYLGQIEARGLEKGREEGREEGLRQGILTVVKARGLSMAAEQLEFIHTCRDAGTLETWLERAATVNDSAQIFEE